ncbi:Ribosomal large subunit pseudouridine synthase D [Sphingobacterium daejeonense]|nr:Ribosomal large subunit pseudouridine synthase D [Sphingobacterium daejeonense]
MVDNLDNEQEEQELYEHLRIVADKGQALLRIDKFLMNRVENTSRNRIQNAIDAGTVKVNDKEVKASYKVKPFDVITVVLPDPPRDTEVYPEDIPLDIIYEDDDVLLVNKEPGMVVHPGFQQLYWNFSKCLDFSFKPITDSTGQYGQARIGSPY